MSFLVRVEMSALLFCALTLHFFLTLFSTPLAPLVTWNSLTRGKVRLWWASVGREDSSPGDLLVLLRF